jgi:hypothetical protein
MISNTIKLSILFVVLLLAQNVNLTLNKNLKSKIFVDNDYTIQYDPNLVPDNSCFLMKNPYTDKCLSWTKEKRVVQNTCNKNEPNQVWRILKEGDFVKFSNNIGEFLEYKSGKSNKGRRYGVSPANKLESQKFLAKRLAYGHTIQSSNNKCMTPKSLDEGSKMRHLDCITTLRLAWRYEKVDTVVCKSS